MTTLKLFDELSALNEPVISRFLTKNADKLIHSSTIPEFVEKIGKLSAKLPTDRQEKVEIILGYTLKEYAEYEDVFEEIIDIENEEDSLLIQTKEKKRISNTKHIKQTKHNNITHALKHVSENLAQTPYDSKLIAKRSSLQKQNHILEKQ